MPSETTTPNIGLQVPAYNQPNWQVPLNYDLNRLDLIFGGELAVPALNVTSLEVGDPTTLLASLAAVFVQETPSGAVPGTVYVLSYTPVLLLGVYVDGVLQRQGVDFTIIGTTITLTSATSGGQNVWAQYFK